MSTETSALNRIISIKHFIERWESRGDEKSETQTFWLEFLRDVCNTEHPEQFVNFEKRVELGHVSFIDAYFPSTRVIVEQKSSDIALDKPTLQSDKTLKTPFEQAKRYSDWLPDSERARWIITCNFREFRIYDMEHPKAEPNVIMLANLEKEWRKFQFLVDVNGATPKDIHEVEISIKAGELVGKLYDALKPRYLNPDSEESLRSLNILCVRIVFLLYAEDTELEGNNKKFTKGSFHDYLKSYQNNSRRALIDLFTVLAQTPEERDPYIDSKLAPFPCVNGGLFEEKNIEIPNIDGKPLEIILHEMSEGFDWSDISPTIFGAVFESTLNPETRRKGGMHYTSIENIHKVIDPLFLNDLRQELKNLLDSPDSKKRTNNLIKFQEKLGTYKFLDPACGSGNFLTETYLSLRHIENQILKELTHQQKSFAEGDFTPIKVSIAQFYGIEFNDFAVAVARTALWIAEAQMMEETRSIIQIYDDVLPLKSYNHIIEANALKLNWNELISPKELNYIMGNPPFVGYSNQNSEQKNDILSVFIDENGKSYKAAGKIDYVAGWYFKASEFIQNTQIKAAFVSTNSITQGEQVNAIFKPLLERFGIHIDFAYQTFVWNSEATEKAHVHIVIIGFNSMDEKSKLKRLYTSEGLKLAQNINFYLVDAPNVFIKPRKNPLCNVPEMLLGNLPRAGGHLSFNEQEYHDFLKQEPKAKKFMRPYMGADEFIKNNVSYCLWLVNSTPQELKSMPHVMKKIEAVKKFRLKSKREATRKLADSSWLFAEIRQPETNYLIIPRVSSENRKYIPIGFVSADVISSSAVCIMPNANLYHFGILTSRVHMAWVRAVAGRLKSDYRYSNTVVYNNFVFPSPSEKQKLRIESTAQEILDARALYPESSFAALYDELTMPVELRKAHEKNDIAVCEAYGFKKDITENEIVTNLFDLYSKILNKE